MELKQYFRIVQRKWWLIAVIVVIAMVATAVKSFYFTTPIYAANAKLIVNQFSGTERRHSMQAQFKLVFF
ncbi:Wzz/FepE/Etk N-terminal domain-containing protein [Paenibacillus sp. JZ16]|uniref:Wzz/FepE/Etk N-terminal domain-containing protein n=1 Tax=Paenibacillus sp. JZ16 TaxID=1906272 RepID=UPI001F3853BE|nr:Wzz/FepE/Etk N-terminal domain-containing protein [Paenibacillus sp. JZ16]